MVEINVVQHLGLDYRSDVVGFADLVEREDSFSHASPPLDRDWPHEVLGLLRLRRR